MDNEPYGDETMSNSRDILDIINEELSKSTTDLDLLRRYDAHPNSVNEHLSKNIRDALSSLMPKSTEGKIAAGLLVALAAAYFLSKK